MIYYALFWYFLVLSVLEVLFPKILLSYKNKRFLYRTNITFLTMFAGLRYGVGMDYFGYLGYFHRIKNGYLDIINRSFEIIPSIHFKIMPSFEISILVIAIFAIYLKANVFFKYNYKYIFTAIFFYYATEFLFYDMGIIRQGLAISICLFSLPRVLKKDKTFFMFVMIATCIHTSSLLFALVWFLGNKEFSRKIYYGISILFFMIFKTGNAFTSFFTPFMGTGNLVSSKMLKYSLYTEADITLPIIRRLILMVIFVEFFKADIAILFNGKKIFKRNHSDYTWLYINSFFISTVLLSICGSIFSSVAGRITECFYISYIFLYIEILSDKKHVFENIFLFSLFALLAFITFNGTITNHETIYLPYESLLSFQTSG